MNKRTFIKLITWMGVLLWADRFLGFKVVAKTQTAEQKPFIQNKEEVRIQGAQQKRNDNLNLGVDEDGQSRIYLAQGKIAEENMRQVLALLGGIGSVIGIDDIVVLKPNAQWWNQGMTNTDAMRAFIEEALSIPGFHGEIIVAENHQYARPDSRGWTTDKRNGAFNYNELVEHFNGKGFPQVTKYHWRCAGPNPNPLQGNSANESSIVKGPGSRDGYVWRDDLVYHSSLGRKCMMTYPVFTSSYSGVTVDLKQGAWRDGQYTGQPVKFINFSAINHHGPYCGVTASVKNYMGVVDMTCGFQGTMPEGYYNMHYIGIRDLELPFQKHLHWRIQSIVNGYNCKYFSHTGGALGMFMRDVRMADLNIITAHWVGYGSRTKKSLSGYPKTILASKDPVALDFVAAQKVLLPLTKRESERKSLYDLNDSLNIEGPFYKFLEACHNQGVGNINSQRHSIIND